MKKYWFNSIFFNNQLLCGHRNRISKVVDSLIPTIGNTSGGEYPILNDTDKNIHSWNNHNQSCIDGYLCSEISNDGDSDSGKSINDNDIDNDSDEILKGGVYYLNRTYLHTEDYTDYIDKYSDESLDSTDNDSNVCNDEIVNGSDSDSLNGFQDFKHLWVLCDECYTSNYKEHLKLNINICEYCGFHLKMNSSDRIELSVDSGTWEPMDEDLVSADPIEFDKEEEVKKLEKPKWWKEFEELSKMLDEIEEKEGAEKKEAAEKLKEWHGWEKFKEKEEEKEEKEEKELEEWKKQWNDWEGWRKQKEERNKACEKLLEFPEDYLKGMRQQETLEEEKAREGHKEVFGKWEELEEQERMEEWWKEFEELFKLLDEIEEKEGAEKKEAAEKLKEWHGWERFKEKEEEKELEEWRKELKKLVKQERLRLRKRLGGWQLRERLGGWKELLALFQKLLKMNFERWKKAEEVLGLLEEGAELEEFKELFEELKEFKRLLKWVKEIAEVVVLKELEKNEEVEGVEEVEEAEEWQEIEEVDEVEEAEEAEEIEEVEEVEEAEEAEEIEEVEEVKEAEEIEEVEEVKEAEEIEEVEEVKEAEEIEEVEEVEGAKEVEEVEEVEEAEEVEEVKLQSYIERIDLDQRKTGLNEAVQTGIGQINGFPVAMGFMDFEFIGGSMGAAVGEKITRLIEYATKNSMPLIMVCASGGARMQEGIFSLMQMAKISSALNTYQLKRKLFYISILTTPTTGGVTASFGMLGDIVIAEPNAFIAFAGPRIIEELLNVIVPEGIQEAEHSFEKGLLDSIVPRNPLKGVLSELFQLHGFFSWSFR